MRVPTALRRAIRNIASVRVGSDDQPFSLRQFSLLCRDAWNDEQYSIPAQGNGILVVNSAQSIGEVRSVYALGMLEGVFPRRRTEDPILTDGDRNQISTALSLDPPLMTSMEYASKERDEFFDPQLPTDGR
jgi:ATP-dependent helicase/DNAse subunit B